MENLITSLLSFTSLVSPLLVFVASCYYLSRGARVDSILLFIGSGIGLFVTAIFSLAPYFMQSRNIPFAEASKYYSLAGIIGFIGGICFAVGFFVLISNMLNAYKKSGTFKPSSGAM